MLQRSHTSYHGTPIIIEFKKDSDDNKMVLGKVLFTKTGQELAQICESEPVPGFLEYVIEKWITEKHVVSSPYPRNIQKS